MNGCLAFCSSAAHSTPRWLEYLAPLATSAAAIAAVVGLFVAIRDAGRSRRATAALEREVALREASEDAKKLLVMVATSSAGGRAPSSVELVIDNQSTRPVFDLRVTLIWAATRQVFHEELIGDVGGLGALQRPVHIDSADPTAEPQHVAFDIERTCIWTGATGQRWHMTSGGDLIRWGPNRDA